MRYRVSLTKKEREELTELTRKGKHNSRAVINSLILLNCDEGIYQTDSVVYHFSVVENLEFFSI